MKINNQDFEFVKFQTLNENLKKTVLKWRNHEAVRKWMYNKNPINLNEHLNFIKNLESRKDQLYFLVNRNETPIGVFSLINIDNKSAEWGYYLAPELHDQHYGVEFYYATLTFCFDILNLENLTGYALLLNRGANSLNQLFGFESKIVKKEGYSDIFNSLLLTRTKWDNEIVNNLKIIKLLELTKNKSYD